MPNRCRLIECLTSLGGGGGVTGQNQFLHYKCNSITEAIDVFSIIMWNTTLVIFAEQT